MAEYLFEADILNDVLNKGKSGHDAFKNEVIRDFWLALISRELSLQGRKEVLTGKAKFGVFSDGKEVAQIALAKYIRPGDHRSGYYRDQTLMMALGLCSVSDYLAQMYSFPERDKFSGGKQMVAHFATPYHQNGEWVDTTQVINSTSGISSTGGQMGRALGLAYASRLHRDLALPDSFKKFSDNGREICICTIGDASTSEGVFWETINAAGVLQVPLVIVVWDDGYGISVPTEIQTTKGSISTVLEGFKRVNNSNGIDLYTVKGWDYVSLCKTFEKAIHKTRDSYVPSVVHVQELTQPQGHSTSGSHERYKSFERLAWEKEYDCIHKMTHWLTANKILSAQDITSMSREARVYVRKEKLAIWQEYQYQAVYKRSVLHDIHTRLIAQHEHEALKQVLHKLSALVNPTQSELLQNAKELSYGLHVNGLEPHEELTRFIDDIEAWLAEHYGSPLFSEDKNSALKVPIIPAEYSTDSPVVSGYQLINKFFDVAFANRPELLAFGEDVGKIGDVNQGMAGLQEKFGELRVADTGIREWTIIGQGVGAAMRGLRPIAEIQYLDYVIYALPILSDDIASLRYRSNNQQQAPIIIRTRGHRLEGIWHSGSPIGMLLNSLRGIYICVPRDFTQAAGMYNTLLKSNDPGLVIECLNGYRLKEKLPDNIGTYTVPLGIPEILTQGQHLTIVSYGSCIRLCLLAAERIKDTGSSVEIIDVQTLLPFDTEHIIVRSLAKTNKLLIVDEDVPGGASAYILREIIEVQGGFEYLDIAPQTLTAKAHRPPYGSDGDYYSKPQVEDIVEISYCMIFETELP